MHRQIFLRTLLVCAASFGSLAVASAQGKVAIINIQKAIVDTAEIKKAQADLEAKYKVRQADLDKAQRELQDLQVQLQNGQGKLSPQGEAELRARGAAQERKVTRLNEDLQADVDRDRNDILTKAGQRMNDVVKKLAEEKGYDMIVEVANLLYWKPAMEITTEATAAYDKAYPVK